jgi:hypothetical protein
MRGKSASGNLSAHSQAGNKP